MWATLIPEGMVVAFMSPRGAVSQTWLTISSLVLDLTIDFILPPLFFHSSSWRSQWAASYDIDEFLSPAPVLRAVTPAPAERILDAADARNESQGHLFFDSIEFHVESQLDSRSLTTYLQRGQLPQLKNQQNLASSGQCYDRLPNTAGKAAVRCDKGLGFTIHYPAVQEDRFGMQVRHGRHADRRIRTWHARLAKAFGKCSYDPQRHGES